MNVPIEEASVEIIVKNSRFIAEIFPVQTQAEARDKLHEQKKRYFDSTHVVHAFITGKDGEVNGMSDDGEPSGTAGRPVLDVLKGSGLTNILLTVTRYFGGTLLGTGGLVHAYGDSAKKILSLAKTEPLVEKKAFSFTADYSLYKNIKHMFSEYHIEKLVEDYGMEVSAKGSIYSEEAEKFSSSIYNLSKGKTEVIFSCI